MFKINLVPEVQEKKQKISQLNYIVTAVSLSVLGAIVIAIVVIGGITVTNKAILSAVERDIREVNTELAQYKDLEEMVLSLESGLAGARSILDGTNSWQKLLLHMEKTMPADVKLTKISLDNGKILASLDGRDVNSLARFAESFKKYELVVLTGSGSWGEQVSITVDDSSGVIVPVKSRNQWVYSLSFDPAVNHKIVVEKRGSGGDAVGEKTTLTYDSAKKEVTSDNSGQVSVRTAKLFSSVEVSQYKKTGSAVSFDATMSFDGALLW
jgi:Tfp pilus assembly protein PilN